MSVKSDRKLMKQLQRGNNQSLVAYLFLLPWLIGLVLFTVGPFLVTFYLSFNIVDEGGLGYVLTNVGFENYVKALLENIAFRENLISFVLVEITYVPAIVIFSFILAILLNRKIKFRSGFRTIFFLPVIVLSSTVMEQLMSAGGTRLSDFRDNIIFKTTMQYSIQFSRSLLSLFDNFTMVLWFTGIPIILFINGLQKINSQLYEAAKIDGATTWQTLWKITVPIIKPTALIVAIFTIVQIGMYNINPLYYQIRDSIYNPAGGLGIASAFSWIYTIVVLIFVAAALLLLNSRDKSKEIKLTSIQRRAFEQLKARRDATLEEVTDVE